jgi:salicylate hydroxylase
MTSDGLALEDAAVLGALFSRLNHKSQTDMLLHAFATLRRCRRQDVAARERAVVNANCAPMDQEIELRRALMGAFGIECIEGTESEGDEIRELMGYDAEEAAEEW